MTIRSCWIYPTMLVGLALSLPLRASADLDSCSRAHTAGQRQENAGHLRDALSSFQTCASDAACPLPIRNECTSLYTRVEGRLPTLVFSVVDDGGNDVTDVRVSSGEAELAKVLDGRPIAVDPGPHELRFELPNGEVLTKSLVVRQGEKDRLVAVKLPRSQFAAAGTAAPTPGGDGADAPQGEAVAAVDGATQRRLTVPLASWISYGVGAAALASWATFGLMGRSQEKELVDCSPNCALTRQDDYDAMKRNYLIADISLGVAAASVVTGTVLLFTMGKRPRTDTKETSARSPTRSLSVAPMALGRIGTGLSFAGQY